MKTQREKIGIRVQYLLNNSIPPHCAAMPLGYPLTPNEVERQNLGQTTNAPKNYVNPLRKDTTRIVSLTLICQLEAAITVARSSKEIANLPKSARARVGELYPNKF